MIKKLILFSLIFIPLTFGESIWIKHPELPGWLHRGSLRWAINYTGMYPADIEYMIDVGESLIQGGGFRNGADKKVRDSGRHHMMYICSRTIYWKLLFKSHPQIEQATIRTPKDEHLVIYNNSDRHAGCYNRKEWLDYIKSLMDRLASQGNETIFFDNPMVWPCYCQTCKDKFRSYSAEKIGRKAGLPLPDEKDLQVVEAAKQFRLDAAERFFATLREFAQKKKPPMYITANNLCYSLIARDITDIVFTEAFAHPPFGRQIAPYKAGLAASRGKPTGVLAYPPPKVRLARGKKKWHEPGKRYNYVTAPLPLEYSLGAAEALACGGNYICNYGVSMGGTVTRYEEPQRKAIADALKPYRTFKRDHPQYFRSTRPGSRIGYLYNWNRETRGPSILGMDLMSFDAAAGTFMKAGLPVDVLTERNIEDGQWSDFDLIILDDISVITRASASGLSKFTQEGGGVLIAGVSPQVREVMAPPADAESLSKFLDNAPVPLSFTYRPKEFQVEGFELEHGYRLKVPKSGKAWLEFEGPTGNYSIITKYLDEDDGQSELALRADGRELDRWSFTDDDNGMKMRSVHSVALKKGSRIELRGKAGGGEYGRIYGMRILGGHPQELKALEVGKGRVLFTPDPISSCAPQHLLKAVALALGRPPAFRIDSPRPDLLISVQKAPGSKATLVHLVNYRFSYEDKFQNPKVVLARDVRVVVNQVEKPEVSLVTVHSKPSPLSVTGIAGAWQVSVPEIGIHCMIAIAD